MSSYPSLFQRNASFRTRVGLPLRILGHAACVTMAFFIAGSAGAQTSPVRDTTARSDSVRPLPGVEILARPSALAELPGSASRVSLDALHRMRVLNIGEALRKVTGVHVRDEEGLGLRPNIGVRGLNPTRSTKVLLLEDGVPFTIAPYGDNASYFHPPIDRFDRVEVVKGASQILYGPNTVGGVVNYLTPGLPIRPQTSIAADGGSNSFGRLQLRSRGLYGSNGVSVDMLHKRADSPARQNISTEVSDGQLKLLLPFSERQSLAMRVNGYREQSTVTYSGLTEAEFAADPRQNPFSNDQFTITRAGGAVTHHVTPRDEASVTTTFYGYQNSAQRPNDASDPSCGGMQNLHTTCGNEGRLRRYRVWGVEPRAAYTTALDSHPLRFDFGARLHGESQHRVQVNGGFPTARTPGGATDPNAGLVEENERGVIAAAAFAQARLGLGDWIFAPGLRVEHMRLTRANRRPTSSDPRGVSGATSLTEFIPGLGLTVAASPGLTIYAGVHRGFSPPRPEDVIDNVTGGAIELPAERSWNHELGVRAMLGTASVDATIFALEFSNQIIAASVAGGTGAALTSAGATTHRGVEFGAQIDTLARPFGSALFVSLATTWLPVARFTDTRYAFVGTTPGDVIGKVYASQNGAGSREQVLVTGNRLPYAPEFLTTAEAGLRFRNASVAVEAVHSSSQFGDPVNTRVLVPDGQQGVIDATTIWNLAINTGTGIPGTELSLAVKNVANELYVVDRTRGLLPGAARTIVLGVRRIF
jgi:Fe(3+) dicitrate transport protein